MTTMIAEVYDALREAGASEQRSRAAAEALASYEDRFVGIDRRFDTVDRRMDDLEREIKSTKAELRGEIRDSKTEVKGDIRLLQWQFGLLIAAIVLKTYFPGH